jgi:hypothetical protein
VLGERALEEAHGSLRRAAGEGSASCGAQQRKGFGVGIRRRHQKVGCDLLLGRVVFAEYPRCASMCLTSS